MYLNEILEKKKSKAADSTAYSLPILACLCILFKGDVWIDVEEDVDGEFVEPLGDFECFTSWEEHSLH
jgi:hypothetical protein